MTGRRVHALPARSRLAGRDSLVTDMVHRTRSPSGRTLAWRERGQGSPVLLTHGFPMTSESWAAVLDDVPAGYRFIAPDLCGFGDAVVEESTAPPDPVHVDEHARELCRLLDHLGLDRAVIGGLSMGGYVAFAMFRLASTRFRAMVLVDTRAEPDTEEGREARIRMQASLQRDGTTAVADAMVPKLLGPAARTPPSTLPDRLHRMIAAQRPAAIHAALDCLRTRPDTRPLLPHILCPALIVVGEHDELTPVEVARGLHRGIARSTLVILPGAGHVPILEQPKAFNEVLARFLASLPPG